MQLHQGKLGGPDCSNATETNQAFVADATGTMKITGTGKPNEIKVLKLSTNQSRGHKTVGVSQTQKSDANYGWGNADGSFHAGGKSPGQGVQVINYDPAMKKGNSYPSYDTAQYLILTIGNDGAPVTYELGLGQAD